MKRIFTTKITILVYFLLSCSGGDSSKNPEKTNNSATNLLTNEMRLPSESPVMEPYSMETAPPDNEAGQTMTSSSSTAATNIDFEVELNNLLANGLKSKSGIKADNVGRSNINAFIGGTVFQKIYDAKNTHPKVATTLVNYMSIPSNVGGQKAYVVELRKSYTPLFAHKGQGKWIVAYDNSITGPEFHGVFEESNPTSPEGVLRQSFAYPYTNGAGIEWMGWNNKLGRFEFAVEEWSNNSSQPFAPHAFAARFHCVSCHPSQVPFLDTAKIQNQPTSEMEMINTSNKEADKASLQALLKSSEIQRNFRHACDMECEASDNPMDCRVQKVQNALEGKTVVDLSRVSTVNDMFVYGLSTSSANVS